MSEAKKQGHRDDDEMLDVGRLQDGRLIWVIPTADGGFRAFVLEGSKWVPAHGVTLRELLDADGLSEEETQDLVARGILRSAP